MSEADTEKLFERRPDAVCTIGPNRILYWSRGYIADFRPRISTVTATNQRQIPFDYGCAQLLFDTEGKLSAYSVVGESLYVVTREGKLKGSDLVVLDSAVFERLRMPAAPANANQKREHS